MDFGLIERTYHVYGIEPSSKRKACCEAIEHTWTEHQMLRIFEQLSESLRASKWFERHGEFIMTRVILMTQFANLNSREVGDSLSKYRGPKQTSFR